jgi:transposase
MAYTIDYIKRAVAYKQEGHTLNELQEAFGIPAETYYDWKKKLENGFGFGLKAKGERKRKIDKNALKKAVIDNPDAFLWEYAKQFNCTPTAVFYALEKLNITLKKNHLPIMKSPNKKELNLQNE